MIFGVKEKRTALGQFTSEKCSSCKESKKYIFNRITKFVVVFFIKLIPISNSYESECSVCDDTVKIDKKAGKKLARSKFGVENSNQNFLIFIKLFLAAAIVAAAIVLPILLIAPPFSPDMVKDLVDEPGVYTIMNKEDSMLAIVRVSVDEKIVGYYNEISDYKTDDGMKFELHKYYEEVRSDEGNYMAPIADGFGALIDENRILLQQYHYDIANDSYVYAMGVKDLSSIEYTDGKTVYPFSYIHGNGEEYNYKLIIFEGDDWEIDVRWEVGEDGTETIMDLMLIEKQDGRNVTETMYTTSASDGSIIYLGDLSSQSTGQQYYNFIMNNDLGVSYVNNYTYFEDSKVLTSSTTVTTDAYGEQNVSEETFDVTKKYNYYIVKEQGLY